MKKLLILLLAILWVPFSRFGTFRISPTTEVIVGSAYQPLIPWYTIVPPGTTLRTTFEDNHKESLIQDAHASSLTANPDSSHIDAGFFAYHAGGGTTYASVQSAATTQSGGVTAQGDPNFGATSEAVRGTWFSNNGYIIQRAVLQFNTSSLTSSASISAAQINLFGTQVSDAQADGKDFVTIVTSHIASLTTVATTDWANIDYNSEQIASASRISEASWSTTGYNQFPLNATGISNISKVGTSKFGTVDGHDLLNTAPAQNNGLEDYAVFTSSASASNKPQLVVTYTVSKPTVFWWIDDF